MITLLTEENEAAFRAACGLDPIFGAQLLTDCAVWGGGGRGADFWVALGEDGRPSAALSRIGGRLMIAAREDTVDGELIGFVHSVGGWSTLRGDARVCRLLSRGCLPFTAPNMIYDGPPFAADYSGVITASLNQLYPLLCAGFSSHGSGWDQWYAMTSHLFRHGLGYALGLSEGGKLVSTAGVYATGPNCGIIACVATLPEHRGRGYAGLLVRCLCDRLLAEGKTPVLQCADDGMAGYYQAMGFRQRGRWGRLDNETPRRKGREI